MTKPNSHNGLTHYNVFCASMMTGCAILNIESSVKFIREEDRGYVVRGTSILYPHKEDWINPFTPGLLSAAVITAKRDGRKVHPGSINNMRVWYRFTRKNDKCGKVRSWLYIAADSSKPQFNGERMVTITADQECGLHLEPKTKKKLDTLYWKYINDWEQACTDSRLSREELTPPHEGYTDPGSFGLLGDLFKEAVL